MTPLSLSVNDTEEFYAYAKISVKSKLTEQTSAGE